MSDEQDYMELARQGLKKVNEASDHEIDSIGNLRVGNTGLMTEDGRNVGACIRRAHLRMKGIEVERHDEPTLVMFAGGSISERMWDIWYKSMGIPYKTEADMPVAWTTTNGSTVTGRPDRVFVDGDGKPVHVMEHKRVSSVWTTREVRFNAPKLNHMAQAAHYARLLDVPATLAYTQDVNYHPTPGSKWVKELLPHPAIEARGNFFTIRPYIYGYHLKWDGDDLLYKGEDKKYWSKSPITWSSIRRFYEAATTEELYSHPHTANGDGSTGYSTCKYCPLKETCDLVKRRELSYEDWLMLVKARPDTTIIEPNATMAEDNINDIGEIT